MSAKRNRSYDERKAWFAEHPWKFYLKETVKGPARFENGLIKPGIRREA